MNVIIERRIELKNLVGKKVSCMSTGVKVKGKVVAFYEDNYAFALTVEHEPVKWGNDTFNSAFITERKCDGFGGISLIEVLQ